MKLFCERKSWRFCFSVVFFDFVFFCVFLISCFNFQLFLGIVFVDPFSFFHLVFGISTSVGILNFNVSSHLQNQMSANLLSSCRIAMDKLEQDGLSEKRTPPNLMLIRSFPLLKRRFWGNPNWVKQQGRFCQANAIE